MKDLSSANNDRARAHTALVFGVFGITISGLFLLYCFAFARIVDPDLQGFARFKLIAYRMFEVLFPGIGTIPAVFVFVASIIHFIRGGCFCLKAFSSRNKNHSTKIE